MDAHIRVKDLSVRYGEQKVLDKINLEIPRNQITIIMGPSGCGKTTLLKGMNRFLELVDDTHVSGAVMIDDQDIYAPGADVTEISQEGRLAGAASLSATDVDLR